MIRQSSGDVQIGVVSLGVGCAYKNSPPGVHARVSAGYEWIREQVCEYGEDPPSYFDCSELAYGRRGVLDTISPWVLIVHVFKKVFEKSVPLPWLEITSVNHVKERNHVKS